MEVYWDAWLVFRRHGFQQAMDDTAMYAFRDATRQVKAAMKRYAKQRKGMPGKSVTRRTRVRNRRGHMSQQEARIIVGLEGAPIYDYPHSAQMVHGVSVVLDRKPVLLRHAFIATMRNGHTGIYRRLPNGGRDIDELFTTQPAELFEDAAVIREFHEVAFAAFDWSFASRMEKRLAWRTKRPARL